MRFSTPLWLLKMLLDVLAKSACCYVLLPSYLIALCLGVIWSGLHLLCLLLASGLMAAFRWPRFFLFGLTLAIANALFLGILYWSVEADATMTLKDASQFATILVPINMLPVLMSSAIDFLSKCMWRSLRTGRVGMIAGDLAEERRFAPFSQRISANSLRRHWILRAKTVFIALVVIPIALPVAAVVGCAARDVYRTNYVCEPGNHVIQSEADAIRQAEIRFYMARYGSHGIRGYLDEKPELVMWSGAEGCCSAGRSTNNYGVIIWTVYLKGITAGEAVPRDVGASMLLSNCGTAFADKSFISAEPIGVDRIWGKFAGSAL